MDEAPQTHKRKPLVAFLLSIAAPGLGQVYNGQLKKGLSLFFSIVVAFVIVRVFHLAIYFYGYIALLVFALLIRIYSVIDAFIVARRLKQYQLKKFNTELFYVLYFVLIMGSVVALATTQLAGVNSYQIPTTSNSPTIQAGDYVCVDPKAYDTKEIACGDIVTHLMPNGDVYATRIIGTPNDVLSIYKNTLTINGKKATYKPLKKEKSQDKIKVARYEEVLPNGVKHDIYMNIDPNRPGDSTKQTIANIVVPLGHYYVMGDNRDNALDSRYTGPIAEEDIIGQLVYVLWGEGGKRMNINLKPQTK